MKSYPIKRGFKYPLEIEDGGLKLSEDTVLVREGIFSVLETRWFERVMRPSYGTPDYIFSAVQNEAIIAEQIRQSLETQIPGDISFRVTAAITDDGVLRIEIEYTINSVPQPSIKYQLQYD